MSRRRRRPDPESWTYKDLYRYLRGQLGLSQGYAEKRIKYLKMLERPPGEAQGKQKGFGLELHHPDPDEIYYQFMDYVVDRRDREEDPEHALKHSQKSMKLLFGYLGLKNEYEWVRIREQRREIDVYPEHVAYRIIHGQYHDDEVVNRELQHLQHFWHYAGPRNQEIFNLRWSDINFEERKVTLRQQKVRRKRIIYLEPFVMTSLVDPSLLNYRKHWWPKLAARSGYNGDRVWLNPDGEPWSYDYIRQLISEKGKQYYQGYHPYLARHFCATYRLMESYRRTGVWDIVGVSRFMDHRGKRGRGIEVTMGYVHIAQRMMDQHMKKRRVSRVSPRSIS